MWNAPYVLRYNFPFSLTKRLKKIILVFSKTRIFFLNRNFQHSGHHRTAKHEPSGHLTLASNVAWIIVNYSSTRVSWSPLAFYDRGVDFPLPFFGKQCYCSGRTMKFCRHLCLPKNPYTKFGCHSLIHDITMASLLWFQQQ